MIKRWNFFTLIELMIVITVIAILAAILMGSYHRATETAHKVVCASNLKQLSIGYTFYAKKSDGEYPPFAWIMNPNGKPGDNDDMFFGGHPPQGGGKGLATKLDGGNWIDSSMIPIMVCPSDEEPETRIFITGVNSDVSTGVEDSDAQTLPQPLGWIDNPGTGVFTYTVEARAVLDTPAFVNANDNGEDGFKGYFAVTELKFTENGTIPS